jgi:predicted transcriptional regulator
MTPKASTVRIEPTLKGALEHLSSVLKRPMNQLVNEALRDFVARRSREAEHELEATLARLRAYRERDPHFKEAIAAVVDAEARYGKEDPAEGMVVRGKLVDGQLIATEPAEEDGPIQSEIHRLLNAS